MAANSNLLISITARDQASGTFRKIRVALGELQSESEDAGGAVEGLGDLLSTGLGRAGAAAGAAFGAMKIAQTALELGKLGAETQRTQQAFADLASGAGQSGDAMLRAMRQATQGTVADSQLMLAANRAMMLGVSDIAEVMSRLRYAAFERGRALGVSSQQAVNDIITGIGRMSPLILDNLGITGAAQAFDVYAASLGKTADQLTDVEKKQALVNAVLAEAKPGGQVVDDAAASFERMDASLQNMREQLGILFSPAIAGLADGLAAAAQVLVENWRAAGNAMDETLRNLERQALTFQDRLISSAGADLGAQTQAQAFETLAYAIEQANQAMVNGVPAAEGWGQTLMFVAQDALAAGEMTQSHIATLSSLLAIMADSAYAQELLKIASAMGAISDATRPTAEQIAATNAAVQQTLENQVAQIMAMARGSLAQLAQEIARVQGADAGLQWLSGANQTLREQIAHWRDVGYSMQQITDVLLPDYINRVRDAALAMVEIGTGAQRARQRATAALASMRLGVIAIAQAARTARAALADMQTGAVNTARSVDFGPGVRQIERGAGATVTLNSALGDLIDTATSGGGGGGGGVDSISSQFDDLRGKIESVIGEAMSADIGGLNPADFLPRQDAINENARRLAAIMRDGLGGQEWLDEFRTEVPGIFDEIASSSDPRGAAARILQEFQQGLRPELLDREQIKQRVRAMLLGEQNTAQLAQEIAAELSQELGVSLGQAQQAVAATLGGGAPGLEGVNEKLQAGPDGAIAGTAFVGAWVQMVTGMVEEFDGAGRTVGTAFSSGFLSTQAAMLDAWASALVGKLIPAVVAALAAQGSRTGAQ